MTFQYNFELKMSFILPNVILASYLTVIWGKNCIECNSFGGSDLLLKPSAIHFRFCMYQLTNMYPLTLFYY